MSDYLFFFFQFNASEPFFDPHFKGRGETCLHFKRMRCLASKVVKTRAFCTGNERSAPGDILIIAES